jgi:hypothetical protein
VRIFVKPEKTNVLDREMELFKVKASMRGSRVPRSPIEPESSDKGDARKVERL